MKVFNLPDLGEGIPEAEIREWYVKVGDDISPDQPLVAMETAKALVDVPAPFAGKVERLYGEPGDSVETGNPLIGFEGDAGASATTTNTSTAAAATTAASKNTIQATPGVRALAKQLGVDLSTLPTGTRITKDDVRQAAAGGTVTAPASKELPEGMTKLTPAKRAMVLSMTQSHQTIVPVTLCDDADLHAWSGKQNVTIRIIRAVAAACKAEPMLNATFDGEHMAYQLNDAINISLAVDTPHGLYVPVLKNITTQDDGQIRERINQFKEQANSKSIAQDDLHGGTIMLSNFGSLAGRYASPIIVPPMVAIVGVGKTRDEVVAFEGQPAVHRRMPLSITVDHRAVTGGEAARFLHTLISELEKSSL